MEQSTRKRVVVTGLGMLTPLGLGIEANWEALMAGRSGIGPVTKFDATEYKSRIAGEVRNFNPEDFLEKKAIKRMDDFIQYAVASARMAMDDSRLKVDEKNADRIGCVIGCGLGGLATLQKSHQILLEKGQTESVLFSSPCSSAIWPPDRFPLNSASKAPICARPRPAPQAPTPLESPWILFEAGFVKGWSVVVLRPWSPNWPWPVLVP